MYQAILFDLDGTLLGLDTERFTQYYFSALTPKLAPWYPEGNVLNIISESIGVMMASKGDRGVLWDVFREAFDSRSAVPFAEVEPVFNDFYRNEFHEVSRVSRPLPLARTILQLAAEITPRVALATMPIFPRIAIDARLQWGNIADFPFALITSMENMHSSKPNPTYFLEIAHRLGVSPSNCLMVGNDYRDDMAALHAGMEVYMVLDDALNSGYGRHAPTYTGSLIDLAEFLRQIRGF